MSQYLLSSNRPWSLRCAGRHYSMYNCKQHITCPGHRGDHGPPLTPLSCKQSATDKHLTRNPLSSHQPQSAPVCAMSTVISLLFYSKQHERWSDHDELVTCDTCHEEAEDKYYVRKLGESGDDDINKWPDARQCARLIIRQEMRDQSYVKITSGLLWPNWI